MRNIYLRQLEIARAHQSDAEALSYLSSIMRSLMQSLALSALEIASQATPTIDDDLDLKKFLDRFGQPSDGLPIEILDCLVPRVRSLVFPGYMKGWFEKSKGFDQALVSELIEWVEFRNRRPGHGVLDAPTTEKWARKTETLIQRILEVVADALPKAGESGLALYVGDLVIPINTPLVIDGSALVIGKIVSRRGVWKIQGQLLSWADARDVTVDLGKL